VNLFFTITAYPPSIGGAQIHTHMLAKQLNNQHKIQVASLWDTNRNDWLTGTTLKAFSNSREYLIDGIQVHRIGLPLREKVRILPFVVLYYAFMDKTIPHIASFFERSIYPLAREFELIHNVRIGREPISYASFTVAKKLDIPFILTPVHHPRWHSWRHRAYINLYRNADAVISLTHIEKQTLVDLGVNPERIFVTGIGPMLAENAHPMNFVQDHAVDGPIVLFVGQHYPYKGYQHLLQAAPIVWNKIPETHFFFIGPSVGRSERHFQSFNDPRIHRLGAVSLQEKTNALAASSVLCVPSTQESFGGVYTEAWSFAKPVIGCNIPAVAEVIEDGINGFLVKQEPTDIAVKIIDLLEYTHLASTFGQAGKRKVDQFYTWEVLAEQTLNAYHTTLGSLPK
jgi:glycosyltransferase involved in cell wall biosynthesis